MMLASIAEREQFRSLLAAKVRKKIQKTAFGEDINTISVQNTVQFVKRSATLRMVRLLFCSHRHHGDGTETIGVRRGTEVPDPFVSFFDF